MKLRQSRREDPDLNMTPLIDVVFLLLIFFMITTTFQKESDLELSLPEASGEPVERDETAFELVIDKNGHYYIDESKVIGTDVETLKNALSKSILGKEDIPFVIRADGEASHQSVIFAMDAASQLNISKIAFATTLSDEGEGQ